MRPDGRQPDQLRPFTIERNVAKFAEGSCLLKIGDTHMLVTATVEDRVPPFKKNSGEGWLTAVLYRQAEDVSEFVVYDAQKVEQGPIAGAKVPRRVPFGFHGQWVAS